MSETTAPPTTEPPAGEEPKTFDAEYVEKLRKENAKYRTEAKANADAAKRLAGIEEAQKTEAEKAADKVRQLEGEVEAARRESLRYRVASEFGISGEKAELLLTGSDEETMRKQAEALKAATNERVKSGNHVPKEGTTPTEPPEDELRAFTRQLFKSGDST